MRYKPRIVTRFLLISHMASRYELWQYDPTNVRYGRILVTSTVHFNVYNDWCKDCIWQKTCVFQDFIVISQLKWICTQNTWSYMCYGKLHTDITRTCEKCHLHSLVCLCWGFTAQLTQWGHVKHGQFSKPHVYWAGLVL